MPDNHVKINVKNELESKCFVLYFPIKISNHFIEDITTETCLNQMVKYLDNEKYQSNLYFY